MTKTLRFINGRVLRKHRLIHEDLWIADGKIIDSAMHADDTIDAAGMIIAPGFIDLQINGAAGIDITSQPEEIDRVAAFLPQTGVTSFLPTVISSPPEHYRKALPLLKPKRGDAQAEILGIHLEGPFFSPERIGAHAKEVIRECPGGWNNLMGCYGSLDGVKVVTLAPEVPGVLSLISKLVEVGVVVAMGHSQASLEVCRQAINAGARLVTHLFNAMGFHHREPGLIPAALTDDRVFYSIIADGVHLHPAVVRMAWRAHPKGLCLVTDAMAALGLQPGKYRLGGQEVEVDASSATIANTTTLAGSILSMDAAVRNLVRFTDCSIVDALEAASLVPATILKMVPRKGTLEIGADADIVLLDKDLHVTGCYNFGVQSGLVA